MSDTSVRDRKIAKMHVRGMSQRKISRELEKEGVSLTQRGVGKILSRESVQEIIKAERHKLAEMVPEAVNNYNHWVRNARMFHDKTDKEIAFRATTKVLESHGLVSGAQSEQVKIVINQGDIVLSPVIEKVLGSFMQRFAEAKPLEAALDVEFEPVKDEPVAIPENLS
jgi:lambda repressor-like predicted transcriptional regulator